jgi:hypothetical protein
VPSILGKITFTKDLSVVKNSELVLEAIVENLEAKQKLFKEIESVRKSVYLNRVGWLRNNLLLYSLDCPCRDHFSFEYFVHPHQRYRGELQSERQICWPALF